MDVLIVIPLEVVLFLRLRPGLVTTHTPAPPNVKLVIRQVLGPLALILAMLAYLATTCIQAQGPVLHVTAPRRGGQLRIRPIIRIVHGAIVENLSQDHM